MVQHGTWYEGIIMRQIKAAGSLDINRADLLEMFKIESLVVVERNTLSSTRGHSVKLVKHR